MRLPWVSRAVAQAKFREESDRAADAELERDMLRSALERSETHCTRADTMMRDLEARHERDMVRAETRYADLLAAYRALRLEGANEPPLVLEPQPLKVREPSEVDKTIREQSEGSQALAAHLRRYARKLKSEGMNDDQIVGKLVQWTTTESIAEVS